MLGKLEVEGGESISSFTDPNTRNLVSEVSITEPRVFGKGNPVKVRAFAVLSSSVLDFRKNCTWANQTIFEIS